MPQLLLLGTQGCHLCEQAEAIIHNCLADHAFTVTPIDIAEQEHWQAQYAVRIPVLLHAESQQALCWPFDEMAVLGFVGQL
ncbi:MAG: glutaredoxin family protein [Methylococcaceae bacterium]|nr:glutaredoxin family protein [Methylococcaceae bacterium]